MLFLAKLLSWLLAKLRRRRAASVQGFSQETTPQRGPSSGPEQGALEKQVRHVRMVFSELAATKWLLPPPLAHPWAQHSPSLMKLLVFSQAGSMICCQVRSRWVGEGESSLRIEGRGPRAHPWFQFRKTSGKGRRNVCHNGQKEVHSP